MEGTAGGAPHAAPPRPWLKMMSVQPWTSNPITPNACSAMTNSNQALSLSLCSAQSLTKHQSLTRYRAIKSTDDLVQVQFRLHSAPYPIFRF